MDDCKAKCLNENNSGSEWEGYWWKGWGGGYCGCCSQTDNINTAWPDATTYRLPPPKVTHDVVQVGGWCSEG